jgi:HPt (histidine-containing phosphotransfer) domain-containing protein
MNDHIAKPIVVNEMFATLAKWVKVDRSLPEGGAGPHADATLEVERIDKRCGLANAGGNEVLYGRILGLFREREADFAQRFDAARAAGDAGAALRAAHDLKAEAGTLGMHGLLQAATALERACVEGAADADVDRMTREVSNHLDAVLGELRATETLRTP